MGRLLLLFVALPALELVILIELGQRIGSLATLATIVVTGIVGAALARRQGLGVLAELQRESAAGRLPTTALLDGAMILVAAALLVTPGVLTDAFGFACLVPAFRNRVRAELKRRFDRAVAEGRVQAQVFHAEGWERREEKVVHDLEDEPRAPLVRDAGAVRREAPRPREVD